MVPRVIMSTAAAVFLATGIAHFATSRSEAERKALANLIRNGELPGQRAAKPNLDADPVGSILGRAQNTRLDPCGPEGKR
jgi:hypothetical protein